MSAVTGDFVRQRANVAAIAFVEVWYSVVQNAQKER